MADYQLNDDVMLYASYATGFISGGFSETCGSVQYCSPYDDEENVNIEVGFKSDLMDGRLVLMVQFSIQSMKTTKRYSDQQTCRWC